MMHRNTYAVAMKRVYSDCILCFNAPGMLASEVARSSLEEIVYFDPKPYG